MTTIKELRSMTTDDLRTEVRDQETLVLKLRLGVKLGKEKDSAKYIRERKQLARMRTIATEKTQKTEGTQMTQKKNSSESFGSSESFESPKKKKTASAKLPKK